MADYANLPTRFGEEPLKSNILNGQGIGWKVINAYAPNLTRDEIHESLASLKAFGIMSKIMDSVEAVVYRIMQAVMEAETYERRWKNFQRLFSSELEVMKHYQNFLVARPLTTSKKASDGR